MTHQTSTLVVMAVITAAIRENDNDGICPVWGANDSVRLRFAPTQSDRRGTLSRHLGMRVTAYGFEEEALCCAGDVMERAFTVVTLNQNSTIEDVYRAARRSILATFRIRALAFPNGINPGEAFGNIRIELNECMLPIQGRDSDCRGGRR